MKANKNQLQEVEQQMEPMEYRVSLPNGETGTVIVDGGTFLLDNTRFTEKHSFQGLVNRARRDSLPEWTKEIPGLVERIQAVFAEEQAKGIDPFVRFANSDGRLVVTDLRAGTSLGSSIADLKKLLKQGKELPRAFSSKQARQLIDLAA